MPTPRVSVKTKIFGLEIVLAEVEPLVRRRVQVPGEVEAHHLSVDKVVAAEPGVRYPRCIAGQGACPPEDVGGPWGYEEFQAALSDPSHPEHDERLEWAGGTFDPHHFELEKADRGLEWLAWRPLTAVSSRAPS